MAQSTPYAVPPSGSQGFSERAMEVGEQAFDRTTEAAAAARDTVQEHPIATLAIVAGLAFAVGVAPPVNTPLLVHRIACCTTAVSVNC
jgi:hypothetical protein